MGKDLIKLFPGKKIAIVDDRQTYSQGLADETRKALNAGGVKEALNDTVTPGEKDYSSLVTKLKQALREELSPRHVPDEIVAIKEVPRTLSGKKLEVPIKRLLTGAPLEQVVNPGTLQNPQALFDLLAAVPRG